jgi:hypothetical protein
LPSINAQRAVATGQASMTLSIAVARSAA